MKYILIIMVFSFFLYACPNNYINDGCSKSTYSFNIPVSFKPAEKVVSLGDTITINSSFLNILKDKDLGEYFVFDSINFHIVNGFIKLDTLIENNKHYSFTDDFEFIVDSIFNFKKGNNYIFIDYHYSDEEYIINYKFIPKKKGLYLFEFASNINLTQSYRNQVITSEDGHCITNRWFPDIITNNGINNNREFLKESPTEFYNTRYYNEWNSKNIRDGAHCFKVE